MTATEATATQTFDIHAAKVDKISETAKDSGEKLTEGIDNMLEEYDQLTQQTDIPFFLVKSANDTLIESLREESPKALWLTLWYEGQLCCLFANSGSGKSIYAVQMGATIAQTRKVLYFDFELSTAQFADRYSDIWDYYKFPDNFYRVEINADFLAQNGMVDVINEIEQTTLSAQSDTIIIDNLTWVATSTEKAEDAGKLMQRFMALKKIYGWSILILAHTPKREKQTSISENDLAGSKVLFNFLDSAFSIGQSQRGDDYRYIIEIKTRKGKKNYGRNNVILTQIVKEDNFTFHKTIGYSTEDIELGTRNRNKQNSDENMKAVWENILRDGSMRYTDLVKAFCDNVKKPDGNPYGIDSAKKKIGKAIKDEILQMDNDGNYRVSVKV